MATLLYFLSLVLLSLLFPFTSSTVTIPLSQFHTKNPHSNPYQKFTQLATSSISRAHHLKNPQNAPISTTPLSSHSYGGYSISLKFGTPPQTLSFIMDTGSGFVWFPCTGRYQCKNCTTPSISTFIPKKSSSVKILGCVNPKCSWVHQNTDAKTRCLDCEKNLRKCNQICPPYVLIYGSGSTGGITLLETLDLPGKKVPEFLVGCSLFSSRQPAGIAGFGRGQLSLPSQLGLKKFSYCLLSHKFDDTPETSSMVLDGGYDSGKKTGNVSYTPLLKNPVVAGKDAFGVYYYVALRKITIGGKRVKIPYNYLSPGPDGAGGTIVDSGTTFTYLNHDVFELLASEIVQQVKKYKRAEEVEALTGLRPCFNIGGQKTVSMPAIRFHFKGGAEMALPLENYFSVVVDEAVCLTMVSDQQLGPGLSSGPAIVLGNYQMQNYYVEFDSRNERFGFRQQSCN
ncbi:hypothetical protein LguiA_021389 [Lonicera macranthoides]